MKKFFLVTCIFVGLTFQSLAIISTWYQSRIVWNYQHNHFERSTHLAKKALRKDSKDGLVHYCLGMSMFLSKQERSKLTTIVDNVLGHLVKAVKREDLRVKNLMEKDTTELYTLKERAIEITKSEYLKFPTKSLKRVQTIIAIYGDSVEIYKEFEVERTELENLNVKKSINSNKNNAPVLNHKNSNTVYIVEKTSTTNFIDTIEQYCGQKLTSQQKKVLRTAFSYNLVSSFPNGNNPQIMQFFHKTGFPTIKNDEVNWCAAFVNFCMEELGVNHPKSLLAKDLLKIGTPIKDPQPGDLVIFWRVKQKGWQGHVGFFIKEDKDANLIYVFGGNQGGSVCMKPFTTDKVLGYRRISL